MNNWLFRILVIFSALLPVGLNAQYNGGSGDGSGNIVMTPSFLDGTDPVIFYTGAAGDGSYSVTSGLLFISGTDPVILFSGGSDDGFGSQLSASGLLNGTGIDILFSGGIGDGTDGQIMAANRFLDGSNPDFLFAGGNADGSGQFQARQLFLDNSDPSILFSGGISDGQDHSLSDNFLLNGTIPEFVFSGGSADGSAYSGIEQLLLNNGDPSVIFSGGAEDGSGQLASLFRLLDGASPTFVFTGSEGNGSAQLPIVQVLLDNGDPSVLFAGGNADGSGGTGSSFVLLDGISPAFIFAGGEGDGVDDSGEALITLNNTHRPGSGTAIQFNGTDQYVNVGDDTSLDLTDGTIEFWFKPGWVAGSLGYTPVVVSKWTSVGPKRRYSIVVNDNLDGIGLRNGSSFGTVSYAFEQGEWYHVAFRDNGSDTRVFVNGVGQGFTGNAFNTDTGAPFNIGSNNGSNPFPGEIDEVRVWSSVLTLPNLRGWMNKKVTSDHPDYANLEGYWRFDEGNGSATKNRAGGYDGTLMNSPAWTTSGAMIGDESTYDFASPTSLSLNVTNAGQLTVDITGGSADGIQIYYIGEAPADVTPPSGFNNLDSKYFGVFIAGTNPVYTVTYDYSGNTEVNDENAIQLAFRSDNSDTWSDLDGTVNTSANTITKTGLSGTEFILGGTSEAALPVTLLAFTAEKVRPDKVLLHWRTASEINNDLFQVDHSMDGLVFQELVKVKGNGNSTEQKEYSFMHELPVPGINYYQLSQLDFDGGAEVLKIISIDVIIPKKPSSVYPNPVGSVLHVLVQSDVTEELAFELIDIRGRKYDLQPIDRQSSVYVFRLNNIIPGIYTLVINKVNDVVYHKLLVR